jgi:hypothetical protein
VLLFVVSWLLVGAMAVGGSIVGAAFGERALFVGALISGAIGCFLAARVASWRKWIARERTMRVAVGALIGFAIASIIATRTLGSPVGPVASSLLVGVGALLANR